MNAENLPAVGAPVEPTVRPVAYLHTVRVVSPHANPNEIDQALSFSERSFPLGETGMFESIGVEPLFDGATLWNACARAGEIERMRGVNSVQEQTAVIVRAALELLEAAEGCEAFTPEKMAAFRRVFGA